MEKWRVGWWGGGEWGGGGYEEEVEVGVVVGGGGEMIGCEEKNTKGVGWGRGVGTRWVGWCGGCW